MIQLVIYKPRNKAYEIPLGLTINTKKEDWSTQDLQKDYLVE